MALVRQNPSHLPRHNVAPDRVGLPYIQSGGGTLYTPIADAGLLAWWDPTTLSAGSVSSWIDRKSGYNLQQSVAGSRPVYSATGIASTYPGVTFTSDGLECTDAAYKAMMSARSTLDFYAIMIDSDTGVSVPFEHSDNWATTSGGFVIATNDNARADSVEVAVNGGGSQGKWNSDAGTATFSSVSLLMIGISIPGTSNTGSTTRRLNNVELAGTNLTTTAAAGNFASADLNVGARAGGSSLNIAGSIGDVAFFTPGTEAERTARARFFGRRYGITI